MTTLNEVLDYISGCANSTEITTINQALRDRQSILFARSAGSAGDTVLLHGLSPKELNGLTGVAQPAPRSRTRHDITLDEQSTIRLLGERVRTAHFADGVVNFVLRGIPIKCCEKVEKS